MKTHLHIVAIALIACGWAQGAPDRQIQALVSGNDEFAFRLYRGLAATEGNLLISPFSISMALAMASAGAAGDTLKEMQSVLAVGPNEPEYQGAFAALLPQIGKSARDSGVTLAVRNSLWLDQGLQLAPPFQSIVTNTYRAQSETTLLLVNTTFFKGTWEVRFPRANTRNAPFDVTPQRRVVVPMMSQRATLRYRTTPAVSVLELPYAQGGFRLIVLLPVQRSGLRQFEESLTIKQVEALLDGLAPTELDVYLPKFAFERDISLQKNLAALGMASAFDVRVADFSRIGSGYRPFINQVSHRAGIEVDENGTTAWAATAVGFAESIPSPPPVFIADHPFLFMLVENSTGSILFMGRVSDPSSGTK
jgi:serpin B